MPDIGMIELILIGIIGFLVLGPERLPEFLAQIAKVIRQGRAWVNSLKNQLEYEKHTLTQPIEDVKEEVQSSVKEVTDAISIEHQIEQDKNK
jgi:sec-independent protein translocase protein TatB